MQYNPDRHHRRSIRLRNRDYSRAGAYFITLCVENREHLFGDVVDGEMRLNEPGKWADECISVLPQRFPDLFVDTHVIMPNHVHMVAVIRDDPVVGTAVGAIHELPLRELPVRYSPPLESPLIDPEIRRLTRRAMLIPKMIGYYRMNVAKQINQMRGTPGVPVWQRNYYERIIRNDDELNRVREYIRDNPRKWLLDSENSDKDVG